MNTRRLQWSIFILTLVLSSSLLVVVHAENARTGQWMIDPCSDPAKVRLTLRYSDRDSNHGGRDDDWGGWGNTQSHLILRAALAGLTDAK